MDSIDLIQWPAMAVTVISAWFIGSQRAYRRMIAFWEGHPKQCALGGLGTSCRARRCAIDSLALQGRNFKVVYHSSSLAGQIAAVESDLAVAVLTRCSVPEHLEILGGEHGLGPLRPMEVAVYRSRASARSKSVGSLHGLLIKTLRISG